MIPGIQAYFRECIAAGNGGCLFEEQMAAVLDALDENASLKRRLAATQLLAKARQDEASVLASKLRACAPEKLESERAANEVLTNELDGVKRKMEQLFCLSLLQTLAIEHTDAVLKRYLALRADADEVLAPFNP